MCCIFHVFYFGINLNAQYKVPSLPCVYSIYTLKEEGLQKNTTHKNQKGFLPEMILIRIVYPWKFKSQVEFHNPTYVNLLLSIAL